jgi:hypothetical protein
MPQQVVAGAVTMCTFGAAPSTLNVLPVNKTLTGGPPAANIMDNKPMVNIVPFGMCMSLANPTVAAATAAAMGVLTPMRTGRADGVDRQLPGAGQHVDLHVYLGRRDFDYVPRASHDDGAVTQAPRLATCTRRFFCRPSSVALSAIGLLFP